jgi:hypothetical protein
MNRSYYQESGKIINSKPVPMVEDKFIEDEKGEMVPDMEFIRDQAKKLNAKTVRTKGGAVLYFNDNYVLIGADGGERLNTPDDAKKDRSKFSLQLGGQTINEDQAYDKLKTNYPELSDEDIDEIILSLKEEANNEEDESYMGQYYINPNDQTIPKLLMQNSLDERETMQQGGRMMNRKEETEDQDGGMALGQIRSMQERLARLQQMIRPNSDLEPWVASKITLADDYLNSVNDYMTYNPEQTGEEEEYDEDMMNPEMSQEAMMMMQQDVPMEMMRYGGNLNRKKYQKNGTIYVPSEQFPRYTKYQDSLKMARDYKNPPVPGRCYPYCPEPVQKVEVRDPNTFNSIPVRSTYGGTDYYIEDKSSPKKTNPSSSYLPFLSDTPWWNPLSQFTSNQSQSIPSVNEKKVSNINERNFNKVDPNAWNNINRKEGGGIPPRYKNMGFTKVGAKRQSTRPGKKWMVLAKKGDDYKVVHGGYKGMKDFTQHGSEKRRDNFWNRMGGKNSSKATDPFSPLYWHKRFGTWKEGGKLYNSNSLSNVDNVDYIENMKRGGMFNLAKARVLYRKGIHNFDQRNPYEHGGYMNDNLSFIEKNRIMRMNRKP